MPSSRLDNTVSLLSWLAAIAILALFVWLCRDILLSGLPLLSWSYLSDVPAHAGRSGGIAPILVSTLLILLVCLMVVLPLGLVCAAFLAEAPPGQQPLAQLLRRSLDILASVPSIVIGLFGNAFFSITLGLGFSILSGGLTLACMVLPLFIRSAETALRTVPEDFRQAAAALGLSRWRSQVSVLLPLALPGLTVALVLSVGRAMAETAALIYTAGYVDRMPGSLLDSGRSLSVHIYDLAMNVPGGNDHAYAASLVLLLLLLGINSSAQWLGQRYYSRSRAV